jgi:protein-tyrosine-phosphatase
MAEAFATAYGSDVLVAASAGLMPATSVHPVTAKAMSAKNIDMRDHFPKALRHLGRSQFDLIVNMSGSFLPSPPPGHVVDWDISDPVYMDYDDHCVIRDEIERRVMGLILDFRREPKQKFRGQGSGRS